MNSLDARARYTRRVIEESFFTLLEEKPVTKITVTELCQKAGINRATFYKHYADIPELLERLEEQILRQLRDFLEAHPQSNFEMLILDVLHYMQREGRRYYALGSNHADPELPAKTFQLCYQTMFPLLNANLPGVEREEMQMLYYYLSQGCGGVLTYWLRSGMKMEPEAVAHMLMNACISTARGFARSAASSHIQTKEVQR